MNLLSGLRRRRRRGATAVQVALVATAIIIVCIVAVQQIGSETNSAMETTSEGVGDPSALTQMVGGN